MNRRRTIVGAVAIAGAIGWYLFRPERLFVNQTVNESLAQAATTSDPVYAGAAPTLVAAGKFHGVHHETMGRASIYRLPDGKRVLRFTEFETSNGPDVHIYLIAANDASDNETVTTAGFIDLGSMKGNQGDQNYDVPDNVDPAKYRAVTVWCKRFGVNFATAPLAEPRS
jgi:hypothetical protein